MSDQADRLRCLVRTGSAGPAPASAGGVSRARRLLFTSGKGGVGTSNLVLNLGLALGALGQRVVMVDADWGRANLDLLCGLAPRCDLGDVLAGDRPLGHAIVRLEAPGEVRLVPGAHAVRAAADLLEDASERLASELADLSASADFLLVDAGSGLAPGLAALAAEVDEVVIVTTPEPTAVADAHAALARFRRAEPEVELRVLVNQAATASEGADCLVRLSAASRAFLGLVVRPLGQVRSDPRVRRAVCRRRPFLLETPWSPAARGVRRLAQVLLAEARPGAGSRPSRLRLLLPGRLAGEARPARAGTNQTGMRPLRGS